MNKRKRTLLIAGSLLVALGFCLLMALNAVAAPAPLPEVGNKWLQENLVNFPDMFDYEKNQTKPIFSSANVIREQVWLEVPCDVDGDGKRDRIRLEIVRPSQTRPENGGLKCPVLGLATPYMSTYASLAGPFSGKVDNDNLEGENNPDTRHLKFADIIYKGPRYKDLLAEGKGDLSADLGKYGIPAATVPTASVAENVVTGTFAGTGFFQYFLPLGYACARTYIIGSDYGEGFLTYGDYAENLSAAAMTDWVNGRLKGYTSPTSTIEVEAPYWATGETAMSGQSYEGTLPFAAAITGVEGLRTIIPFAPVTSSYEYYRANGGVYAPGGWQGEDVSNIIIYCFGRGFSGTNTTPSSPVYPTPAVWARFWEYIGEAYQAQDRVTGDYNEWWDGRNQVAFGDDVRQDLGIIMFHGFNDENVKFKQTALINEMAKKYGITAKAIFHQGMHTSPYNHAGLDFYPMIHKWLDHYLYGVENGMPDDFPDVRVQSNVDISWKEYPTWPMGVEQKFYPTTIYTMNQPNGGRVGALRTTPPLSSSIPEILQVFSFKDEFALGLDRGIQTIPVPNSFVPNYALEAAKYGGRVRTMASAQFYRWRNYMLGGPDSTTAWTNNWTAPQTGVSYDLNIARNDRLLYTMDIAEDITISGTIKMSARVAANKKVGYFSAMLVDFGSERRYGSGTASNGSTVRPDGVITNLVSWTRDANNTPARIISRGSVDVQNPSYDGKIWSDCFETNWMAPYTYQTTAITPGQFYNYTWEMDVMEYTVLKGHKLALMIYGTDPEYTERPFNPTEFTVAIGPDTYLSLPIVPALPEKPVTIEVANVLAKPGDLVDVTYKIKDNAFGFSTLDLKIPYDSNVYTPESVKAAGDLNTPYFVCNPLYAANTMRIAFAADENVEGDGLLFTVTYKVAAAAPGIGDYPLNVSVVKMQYATALGSFVNLDAALEPGCLVIGILGDVNGDGFVTPEDAMLILQMLVGLIDWTPRAQLWGDINGDGLVDTTDAALILRMVVGSGAQAKLLYQGHASLRITTAEGKVIYIDPYAGTGYNLPADLILITHSHSDHTAVGLIETKNPDCQTITYAEALVAGEHKTFDLGFVTVEAVEAGNNPNHNINVCVGYILTFKDGKTVYVSGDTSKTAQMATFAARNLDYAFFCCDGVYNMGMDEAIECALLVGAKHSIPYHLVSGQNFNRERAELFNVPNRLIIADGEEIGLQ